LNQREVMNGVSATALCKTHCILQGMGPKTVTPKQPHQEVAPKEFHKNSETKTVKWYQSSRIERLA